MKLDPKQQRKIKKITDVVKEGNLAIVAHLFEIEERLDEEIPEIKDVISRVRGDKGDIGQQGIQGEKGETGSSGKDGSDGKNGIDGKNGLNGKDSRDGREGIDGRDGVNGLDGRDGMNGSPDTGDQIVDKINSSGGIIKKERIEGLSDLERIAMANANASAMPVTTSFFNGLRAKNLNILGSTASQYGDTVNITLPSSVSGSGFQIPTGTVNGVNKIYIYPITPNAIVVDGATLQKTQQDGTINWSGTTTVTLSVAPTMSTFAVA